MGILDDFKKVLDLSVSLCVSLFLSLSVCVCVCLLSSTESDFPPLISLFLLGASGGVRLKKKCSS